MSIFQSSRLYWQCVSYIYITSLVNCFLFHFALYGSQFPPCKKEKNCIPYFCLPYFWRQEQYVNKF